jgi:hypothetical protein
MGAKKLTLRIDEEVIERAKSFSKAHDVSLSYLVGRYLDTLTEPDQTLMPTVKRLKGTLSKDN